jgi:hypothetical protein
VAPASVRIKTGATSPNVASIRARRQRFTHTLLRQDTSKVRDLIPARLEIKVTSARSGVGLRKSKPKLCSKIPAAHVRDNSGSFVMLAAMRGASSRYFRRPSEFSSRQQRNSPNERGANEDNLLLTTKDEPLPTTTANGPTHKDNPKQGKRAAEDPNNGANRRAVSGWRQWSEFGGGRFSFRESGRQNAVHSQAT